MLQWDRTVRDIQIDQTQVLQHKGYEFPRYEGRLTDEEFKSKQTFYAVWGCRYMTAPAIRYHVSVLLERRRLPIAA
jgi:hypothetical protein